MSFRQPISSLRTTSQDAGGFVRHQETGVLQDGADGQNVGNRAVKSKGRKTRDLTKAVTLRPIEIYQLYGIPTSTLCILCKHPDPEKRLPSRLTPGRSGRKGLRLVFHDDLRRWLDRWKQ